MQATVLPGCQRWQWAVAGPRRSNAFVHHENELPHTRSHLLTVADSCAISSQNRNETNSPTRSWIATVSY